MSAEAITYSLLTASTAVAAIVGDRIYPDHIPQGVAMPAIAFDVVSLQRLGKVSAASGATQLSRARVQINLVGPDLTALLALRQAVIEATEHQRGSFGGHQVHLTLHGGETSSHDVQLSLFHRTVDILITFED